MQNTQKHDKPHSRIEELLKDLQTLLARQQREVGKQWNRSLPLGDYIVDRWEKAEGLGFGSGSSIYDGALVLGDVSVGRNTWIGPFTILDGSGGLNIGDNCSISAGCQIYSHDSVKWATSGGAEAYEYALTKIGDNCYIGPNSVIAMGVTIGNGTVVGAGSVVLRDIPQNSRFAGAPAKNIAKKSSYPDV